jgi:ERF superfamily protein
VQRSSETIGAIAAALAKAQADLVNPEKSLVGTIRADTPGAADRCFRYAPLSTGLDIVRKTLSQHEIATVQTTSIDETADIVRLSTVLAHASGEWIASDWPVCAISETAAPHRMGAALTYARRYGLFTLVGIAGEDDLDAPDLIAPTTPVSDKVRPIENTRYNGGHLSGRPSLDRQRKGASDASNVLKSELSASLREQLLGELKNIGSPDDAAKWAHRIMGAKNTLARGDAECVEQAFQAKLAAFSNDTADGGAIAHEADHHQIHQRKRRQRAPVVDKSALALPATRRIRDREHVKSVAQQPCLVCGRRPADAHHLRFAQSPALGRKVSDEFTVPLCRGHHREVHRDGDEANWWKKTGIDPTTAARVLWLRTHPLASIARQARPKKQNKPNLEASSP